MVRVTEDLGNRPFGGEYQTDAFAQPLAEDRMLQVIPKVMTSDRCGPNLAV